MQNIQEMQRSAAEQQQQSQGLQERLSGLQADQEALDERIASASQVCLLLHISKSIAAFLSQYAGQHRQFHCPSWWSDVYLLDSWACICSLVCCFRATFGLEALGLH